MDIYRRAVDKNWNAVEFEQWLAAEKGAFLPAWEHKWLRFLEDRIGLYGQDHAMIARVGKRVIEHPSPLVAARGIVFLASVAEHKTGAGTRTGIRKVIFDKLDRLFEGDVLIPETSLEILSACGWKSAWRSGNDDGLGKLRKEIREYVYPLLARRIQSQANLDRLVHEQWIDTGHTRGVPGIVAARVLLPFIGSSVAKRLGDRIIGGHEWCGTEFITDFVHYHPQVALAVLMAIKNPEQLTTQSMLEAVVSEMNSGVRVANLVEYMQGLEDGKVVLPERFGGNHKYRETLSVKILKAEIMGGTPEWDMSLEWLSNYQDVERVARLLIRAGTARFLKNSQVAALMGGEELPYDVRIQLLAAISRARISDTERRQAL